MDLPPIFLVASVLLLLADYMDVIRGVVVVVVEVEVDTVLGIAGIAEEEVEWVGWVALLAVLAGYIRLVEVPRNAVELVVPQRLELAADEREHVPFRR